MHKWVESSLDTSCCLPCLGTRWSHWRVMLATPAEGELMLKVWVVSAAVLLPGLCGAEVAEQLCGWPGRGASRSRCCSWAALLVQDPNAVLQLWELPLPQINSDVMYLWRASQNVFWTNLLSGWWNSCLSSWETVLISQSDFFMLFFLPCHYYFLFCYDYLVICQVMISAHLPWNPSLEWKERRFHWYSAKYPHFPNKPAVL